MIRELPAAERPREKMLGQGGKSLSNTELLALLIGSGTRDDSAIVLASRVLAAMENGLHSLLSASPEELILVKGIGEATACRLLAAAEIGMRISAADASARTHIGCPADVAAMYMAELGAEKQECLITLLLNARNEVIGKELITRGGISSSIADPRDVFRPAVKRGAGSIILVHNHPSGNPEPSESDVMITKRLCEAGALLGIEVIDHIIIGKGRHTSMKNKKLM
jgi:DNA repair protein RadC